MTLVMRRSLALATALSCALMVGTPAWSSDDTVFSGRVMKADGLTPRDGIVVALVDENTTDTFRSQPTDDSGDFRIEQAPPGEYRLLAETGDGAYLYADPIELAPGTNQPVALTLSVVTPAQTGAAAAEPDTGRKWVKWVLVGVISVAALYLIYDSVEEEDASRF